MAPAPVPVRVRPLRAAPDVNVAVSAVATPVASAFFSLYTFTLTLPPPWAWSISSMTRAMSSCLSLAAETITRLPASSPVMITGICDPVGPAVVRRPVVVPVRVRWTNSVCSADTVG